MKKTYIVPDTQIVLTAPQTMICQSVGGVNSSNGIDYGGVDEDGTMEPSARRHHNDVWNEDMEESD